jgi:hypothetical protein
MRQTCLILLLGTFSSICFSQNLGNAPLRHTSWNWLSPALTPCEGIGVTGSARYFVEVDYKVVPSNPAVAYIMYVRLYGGSAAFGDDTALSAKWVWHVKGTNGWQPDGVLSRPTGQSLEAEPGPNQTRSIYWVDSPSYHAVYPNTGMMSLRFSCKLSS